MEKIYILLLVFVINSATVHGQEKPKKQIRISEESLTSLINKIKIERQGYLLQKKRTGKVTSVTSKKKSPELRTKWQNQKTKQLLELLKKVKQQKVTKPCTNANNYNDRSNELHALKKEIEILKMAVNRKLSKPKSDAIIIYPKEDKSGKVSAPKRSNDKKSLSLKNKIDSLNTMITRQSLDSLGNDLNKYIKDMEDLSNKIISLKEYINSKQPKAKKIDEKLYSLKQIKKTIYFDNNSKKIKPRYASDLKDILNTLEMYNNVDILINGFASKRGNPIYNENLSMQRTEAVKQWLIAQNIHPIRILTSYHGIDYTQNSEAKARRVEIKYIIRN